MTVLHVIEPFAGGVATFLVHLTDELRQHHHIVLHGSRTTADRMDLVRKRFPAGVEFVIWEHAQREIHPLADIKAFFFLLRYLKKQEFDIIHLHSAKAGFLGRIACFILGIRNVLYTPHASPFLRRDVNPLMRFFYILLEKFSSHLTGTVVCCCPSELKAFEENRIEASCINNGTPISTFQKKEVPVDGNILVIFSAFLTRQKDPGLFNSIASHFTGQKNIEFCWIGDGDLRNEVTSPNITVTGWLQPSEIVPFFQRASIYLATSAWEGLPYSVLEAMDYQCCLLLSNCDGHRDVVIHGENGFLFNNAEEAIQYLYKLLSDHALILRMGKNARQICEKSFEAEKMANAYNDLYLGFQNGRIS